jgi:hypothetical protein
MHADEIRFHMLHWMRSIMTFHGFPYAIWQLVVYCQHFCEGTLMMVGVGDGVLVKALRY